MRYRQLIIALLVSLIYVQDSRESCATVNPNWIIDAYELTSTIYFRDLVVD